MMIKTIGRKLGLVCLCCGLGLATVHAVEDDAVSKQKENFVGTEGVASETPEVYAGEEPVIPCDEDDEREACVWQRTEIRSRGNKVPPQIPLNLLVNDLVAALEERELQAFDPGGQYLLIYNLGGNSGIFCKWSLVFGGKIAFSLKDRIDRRFMEKFQALEIPR